MRINSGILIAMIAAVLLSAANQTFAQTEQPTPAPSKTATPATTDETPVPEETAEATDSNVLDETRRFTQAELSVLVGNVQRPNGIVWFNDNLYTACIGDSTLYEIDSTSGETRTFIFGIRDAHSLYAEETDAGFDLWVPDFATNTLYQLDQARALPNPITQDLQGPWGITRLDENGFIITNLRAGELVYVTSEGEITTIAEGLRSPAGVVIIDDMIVLANNGSARRAIEWAEIPDDFNPAEDEDPVLLEFKPLVSGLQNVSSLALAPDGDLYFAYALGQRGVIGRVNPEDCIDGGCTNDETDIVVYSELDAPLAGLTISDDMRLFMHSIYLPEIYWVDLNR